MHVSTIHMDQLTGGVTAFPGNKKQFGSSDFCSRRHAVFKWNPSRDLFELLRTLLEKDRKDIRYDRTLKIAR